jgi:hypothetical protein
MEAHVIASSFKGTELIPPWSDRGSKCRCEVTSEGEDTAGFAWARMMFVLPWPRGVATMTLYRLLTYLKTPLLKVTFICYYYSSKDCLDIARQHNESIYSVYQDP